MLQQAQVNRVLLTLLLTAGISVLVFGIIRKTDSTLGGPVEVASALTTEQKAILYQGATEIPFTSELLHEKRAGTYVTAGCGEPVFRSEQKFDSGTGWPSFWAPIATSSIQLVSDTALLEQRTEVRSTCGEHLGHVFTDGPQPTGLRYCINGKALRFIPDTVTSTTAL